MKTLYLKKKKKKGLQNFELLIYDVPNLRGIYKGLCEVGRIYSLKIEPVNILGGKKPHFLL